MSRSGSVDGGELDGETYKKVSASALKAKFENQGNESEPPKRNFVINKGKAGEAAKKFNQGPSTSTKCTVCDKTVYPMEKIEIEGRVFHKKCLKCETCNKTLTLGNYAALEGKYYCKPHLQQLFKLKGNYDEGFGREQRKKDWVKQDDSPRKSTTPAESLQDQNSAPVEELSPPKQKDLEENDSPNVEETEPEQLVNGHQDENGSVEEESNNEQPVNGHADATDLVEGEGEGEGDDGDNEVTEIQASEDDSPNAVDDSAITEEGESENISTSNVDIQNGEVDGNESGGD